MFMCFDCVSCGSMATENHTDQYIPAKIPHEQQKTTKYNISIHDRFILPLAGVQKSK